MENVKKRPSMSPVAPLKNQNNSARVTYFTGDSDDSIYRPLHAASSAISNTSRPSAFKHQLSPPILSTIKILAKGCVHPDLGKRPDAATLCIRLRSELLGDRGGEKDERGFIVIREVGLVLFGGGEVGDGRRL
ncbi:hypothetical protein Tco_0783936 [Tanacetum coccineum]